MGNLNNACNFCVVDTDKKDKNMEQYKRHSSYNATTANAKKTAAVHVESDCVESMDSQHSSDLSATSSTVAVHSETSVDTIPSAFVFPQNPVVIDPVASIQQESEPLNVEEDTSPHPHALLPPILTMFPAQSSKVVIKEHVLRTYDVDDDSPYSEGSDCSVDSVGNLKLDIVKSANLYRPKTNTEWTADNVVALQNEMSMELDYLKRNSDTKLLMNSGSESVDELVEMASPQSLFRKSSDNNWDAEEIEEAKTEMAKHMVHLHTKLMNNA